jgi:hypothetical protein
MEGNDSDDVDKHIERSYESMNMTFESAEELIEYAKKEEWGQDVIEPALRTRFPNYEAPATSSKVIKPPTLVQNTSGKNELFNRYLEHLYSQKWGTSTINNIKTNVEETYLRMQAKNPLISKEERAGYGLVVGRIQSGKTAHMLGLSFRAIDTTLSHTKYPYDTVIILSGLLEDLRKQTFQRLINTGINNVKFLPEKNDFSENNAAVKKELVDSLDDDNPIILVIKKNHIVLEALIEYFTDEELVNQLKERRVLIIDDECDHASIDSTHTETEEKANQSEITATNRAVRGLIKSLNVSKLITWYIGYTATPYSNLLLDPEPEYIASDDYGPSLFPRDMIHCLPKPIGHSDNEYFFSKKGDIHIVQFESPEFDGAVERSHLRKLINLHVLAKLIREQTLIEKPTGEERKVDFSKMKHSTMIHTEVETDQHIRIAMIVSKLKDELSETNDDALFSQLDALVNKYYPKFISQYNDRKQSIEDSKYIYLKPYYSRIDIIKLNAEKDNVEGEEYKYPQELDYQAGVGFSHIVIGGQKLSRGLTIEDLVLVWFDRTPKTPNYDTLLQMARWCGYRGAFLPLVRIFMGEDTILNFSLIAEVERRLRADLLKFTKDTDPLKEVQWIREYKGMRISARASPNATKSENPSAETFLEPEFHISNLHVRTSKSELTKIQFDIYSKFEYLHDEFEDDFSTSSLDDRFTIASISWQKIEPLIKFYLEKYQNSHKSKKFLKNLLVEIESSNQLSDEWNVGLFQPKVGEIQDEFTLSELGYKTPKENLIKIPKQVLKIDYKPGQTSREIPFVCIYLENPNQTQSGIPIYENNGQPIVMLSFYLPEKALSPTFVEWARPGAQDNNKSSEEE